jgi:hypothetical protein
VSCTFTPSGQIGADGSIEPGPDADPLRPDARPADAGIGAPDARVAIDAGGPLDGCEEWTPRPTHFDPCDLPAPSALLDLNAIGDYVYDTDQGTLHYGLLPIAHASVELPGTPPVRAISVSGLRVSNVSRLRVVGSRPLLVASWSTIEVNGTIDVSSTPTGSGAGADTGACNDPQPGGQNDGGGGGGGGGGFRGKGGEGGDGSSSGNNEGGTEGAGVPTPGTVRGGCPGASGGQGNAGNGSGAGGAGGGALQLTARTSIDIEGRLHAGGSGGGGANGSLGSRAGGGGGGSGGLLDLEAPAISFGSNAIVAANGGGGGEGTQGAPARPGDNGQISADPAVGGTGGSDEGGAGGAGSAGGSRDGSAGIDGIPDGVDESGGGGGGGGAGYIILAGDESVTNGAVLSPQLIKR